MVGTKYKTDFENQNKLNLERQQKLHDLIVKRL